MTIATNTRQRNREKLRFNQMIDLISAKYARDFSKEIRRAMNKAALSYGKDGYVESDIFEKHQRNLRGISVKMYDNSTDLAAERQFQSIQKAFNLRYEKKDALDRYQELALGWIIENSRRLAKLLSDTTEKQIKTAIFRSQRDGLPVSETVRVIRDKSTGIARARAFTIAVTETHKALSWAKQTSTKEIANEIGLDLKKVWNTVEDERTRISHSVADGQVVDMNDSYVVDGEFLKYPGDDNASPGNVINCRCTETYERA